ncbi:signal recognition particle-docking protein FtsY [Enterococcus gilvus]|uniref:signal recognition particle-docking protein FtsY n=1 Tax=Enterococcus gilvus TaxID=160453 RepID=UPI0028D62B87|nr:signal recognition particle-docking protein FtsY [Enterococcus gilvus]
MGLFDRIKKAFTGEQTDEPEKQEEVVEETKDSSENGDGVETTEVTKDTDSEDALETDEVAERSAEEEEEALEQAAETIDVPAEEVFPTEPEIPDLTEETEEVAQPTHEDDDTSVTENEAVEDEKAPEVEETIPEAEPEIEQSSDVDQSEETVQEKYDKGLEKTRKSFGDRMNELFARFRRVDEDFFEELEETLIGADVGFDTAIKLTDSLRQEVKLKNAKKPAQIQNVIIEKLVEIYEAEGINENNKINLQNDGLSVILFVGVNGTGKTTSIGKLANQYKNEGKKVLLAAADTFRAGAIDQLVVWGERSGVEVVRGNAGGDPAAVVFDAVDKAKKENYDILLIDTAGRLQNKVNLMNELEKIKRVIQREFPTAPHEVLLVVDATTGQNALVQARQFKETTDVTGLVLTKLDGTAKGGIVLAIRNELHLPVKLVGLGEGINDLEAFDSNDFAVGLFKGLLKEE